MALQLAHGQGAAIDPKRFEQGDNIESLAFPKAKAQAAARLNASSAPDLVVFGSGLYYGAKWAKSEVGMPILHPCACVWTWPNSVSACACLPTAWWLLVGWAACGKLWIGCVLRELPETSRTAGQHGG